MSENEYCWCVTAASADDGTINTLAYFTTPEKAADYANQCIAVPHVHVVQCALWKDGDEWYRVERTRVDVDLPRREDVLANLSKAEKAALGIR